MKIETGSPKPKWLLWAGLGSLLWNLFGVAAFIMQATMSDEALSSLPAKQQELWGDMGIATWIAYAVAVGAGTLGAIGIILGRKWAVLLFLLNPILAAVPTFARYIAIGGAVVTVALEIWIAVRLSLIAVETFAEKRFHLTAYWPLARGYFWRLLWAYILVGLEFLAFLLISFLAVLLFGVVQGWIGDPQGADILRRGLLLGMAGVLAAFAAILLVIPSILVSACQAYAFRAFADDSPTVYGMSWADVPSED